MHACSEESNEWEWCKKRLTGSNRGPKSTNASQGYNPWWGMFMETVQLRYAAFFVCVNE